MPFLTFQALRFARNFIDMIGRDVDVEAQKLLANLRDEKLPQKLPEANISRFEVSCTVSFHLCSVHVLLMPFYSHYLSVIQNAIPVCNSKY